MSDFLHPESKFLQQVIVVIEDNLANESFSVEELAEQMTMSRSNLLRKVKSLSGVSVSVFIRKVRLNHALSMLKDGELTASEVSYKVGFSSVSYFTKCFREEFGFTPGSKDKPQEVFEEALVEPKSKKRFAYAIVFILFVAIAGYAFFSQTSDDAPDISLEKSIAVLPFINNSNDSSNVYIINGLMDAILNNLQLIKELEVTSRTTTEKYRGASKTISELSKELEVNYFVEGSGQKIGNEILLSIQLIDAQKDKHIWSGRYERKAEDIFQLQTEVAKNIAEEIKATITPEEEELLDKIPTENLLAYDYYLKGLEYTSAETREGLFSAIEYFEKAIEEDESFANAYAYIAVCYYYVDLFQVNKQHGQTINNYADKAMLLDPENSLSLIAKGLYYMNDGQYEFAIEHFERVLEISPSSAWVHNFLTDIYTSYVMNTEKYLTHALRGIKSTVANQDSMQASFTYLHLSNALAQNGFVLQAEKYIIKSLAFNPENLYSQYLHTYIKLAKNFQLEEAKEELLSILAKDTTRLDVVQEIAKVFYMQENWEEAWTYYKKFLYMKNLWSLDVFAPEDLKIAYVLEKLGRNEEAEVYYQKFMEYVEEDESIYKDLSYAGYYAAKRETDVAIEYLNAFTEQRNYIYWLVLFLEQDPVISELADHPAYNDILKRIVDNFWQGHQVMRQELESEGII